MDGGKEPRHRQSRMRHRERAGEQPAEIEREKQTGIVMGVGADEECFAAIEHKVLQL